MPSLRQTSATVSPLARSRLASRSSRPICSAVRRLLMSPSWTYSIRIRTLITAGPTFGGQTKDKAELRQRLDLLLRRLYGPRSERINPDQLLLFAEGAPAQE